MAIAKNALKISGVCLGILLAAGAPAQAQHLHNDLQATLRAKVVDVISEEKNLIPGTTVQSFRQKLKAEVIEGSEKGNIVELENDLFRLEEGDKFFMSYLKTINGDEFYTVQAPDRRAALLTIVGIFITVFLGLTGMQGLRSLLSLAGSFFIITYMLVPRLLDGASPVGACMVFSIVILAIVMYATNGFTRLTTAAFLGTTATVALTVLFAELAVQMTQLSGFVSEEAVSLNLSTGGTLDLTGLLLGGIIIGAIGVLDDIAITQAAAVEELFYANPTLSRSELFKRAMRIGREHISALINTLALAYTGASLPLLLLFYTTNISAWILINREIFAAEIIRTIIGSSGLILAVPITTWLAARMVGTATGPPLGDPVAKRPRHHHSHATGQKIEDVL